MAKTFRIGVYDADRRLVAQQGPTPLEDGKVVIDPPLDVPAGGRVLIAAEGEDGVLVSPPAGKAYSLTYSGPVPRSLPLGWS